MNTVVIPAELDTAVRKVYILWATPKPSLKSYHIIIIIYNQILSTTCLMVVRVVVVVVMVLVTIH